MDDRVLAEISEDSYSSGQAISKKLNMTRSAVWKHIVRLRERGYVIDALPRHGYRLAGRPDKLLPAEITPLMKSSVIGRNIFHLEETGSTADEARRLIGEGVSEGTAVFAEYQSSGRGRLGREWQTPPGQAIALSVVLYPSILPAQVPLLSLATGLAVRNAVESATGGEASPVVKWPNDVYLNGRKLAGVLVEMAAEMDQVKWAIDSIGINVNNSFKETSLRESATSLANELGRKISRCELAAAVLDELDSQYSRSGTPAGLEAIRRDFEKLDLLQGHKIRVSTPGGIVKGIAMGIDAEGRLLVRDTKGSISALFSGEASLSGAGRFL